MRYASFDVLALRGPEALAFAQAQLASDVLALGDGEWHWTAWLTAQGRTIAVMPLARIDRDALELYVPAQRGAELAPRLQRYVFRSRLAITLQEGAAGARRGPCGIASGHVAFGDGQRALGLAPAWSIVTGATPTDEAAWRAHLVEHGIPLLAGAAAESQTPHALGLDGLGAVSTRKGCYPGQEIVARTHFLGRNKRHLYRFAIEADVVPEPGTTLQAPHASTPGEVVLAYAEGVHVRGLAVAHEQALASGTGLTLGGRSVALERARIEPTDGDAGTNHAQAGENG